MGAQSHAVTLEGAAASIGGNLVWRDVSLTIEPGGKLQFLITDGETFFHEEKRDLENTISNIEEHTLGYHIESIDRKTGGTVPP